MMKAYSRPYIIIGCHRSGTSWLTQAMHRAGIHMGAERDHNEEALHFLSLNQQTLAASGCSWDKPCTPKQEHWPAIDRHELLKIHFQNHQRRQLIWRVLSGNAAWGWKDPRNTFTLPLWLKHYPKARIIHLIRNQDQVVDSLMRRESKPNEVRSTVQRNKQAAEHLWNIYTSKAKEYRSQLNAQYIEVHYEKLLTDDGNSLNRFCGRDITYMLQKTKR